LTDWQPFGYSTIVTILKSAVATPGPNRFTAHPLGHHRPARFHTSPAGLGTFLAVLVIVFTALLGAPLADISAEPAVLRLKLALAHDGVRTKGADIDAFSAALWTVIM